MNAIYSPLRFFDVKTQAKRVKNSSKYDQKRTLEDFINVFVYETKNEEEELLVSNKNPVKLDRTLHFI